MSPSHGHGGCQHSHFDFSGIKNDRMKRFVTYTAVLVALSLILAKIFAWFFTGSVSILSSLADSILDMLASVVNMFAVHHAMRPADKEHQFGHGKIEAIAALAQASIIFVSVLFVYYEAINRFINPVLVTKPTVGVVVMLFSIMLTIGLVIFQTMVIRRTRSIAITADSMHYKADLYLNIGVLVSLFISSGLNIAWLDPLVGIAIGSYILMTSWRIAKAACDILMDRELPDKSREKIIKIIKAHPKVKGLHALKTRSSGTQEFIQVHLEMDGKMSLHEAHDIAQEIDDKIQAIFPRAYVTIHQDPEDVVETHVPT